MQDMLQNKTQVETVNFRLYFKVIIRQNEIQYLKYFLSLRQLQKPRAQCQKSILGSVKATS